MSQLYSDSIFWIEVEKIEPNPYQPRKEFNQEALEALAESIRQYGVLQPLVATRHEHQKPDGGIAVSYELIAGERRLRAAKIAGVVQVPVVIRTGEDNNLMKLELSIIENLQREDLNPVDRARAFQRFVDEFHYKHSEIAKKIGKSREYVSNSLRLLALPEEVLDALAEGKITEGHARPIMMLSGRPEEQMTLFKEVLYKKLTVRDAESIARRVASDKIRKKSRQFDPEILEMEKNLTEQLGARVHIEPREVGGKITIDFFSDDDLKNLLTFIHSGQRLAEESGVSDLDMDSEIKNSSQDSLSQEEEEKQKEQDNIAPDFDDSVKDNVNSNDLAQEESVSSTGGGGDMEDYPAVPIAPSPSQGESHAPQIDDNSMNTIPDNKSEGFSESFKETAERIEKEKKHQKEMLQKSKDVFVENIAKRNILAEDTVEEVPVPKAPTKNETENEMPNKVTEKNLETSPLAEAMFGGSPVSNDVGTADVKNTSGNTPKEEKNIQRKSDTHYDDKDDELYSIKNFSI